MRRVGERFVMRYRERMQIKIASSIAVLSASLALACGATPPAPSTTAPAGTGGIGQGADPTGTFPAQGPTVTSGAPASPIEGKCRDGAPSAAATDLATCMESCKGMDDTVPLGSRCISAKASCASQCNTKFKK